MDINFFSVFSFFPLAAGALFGAFCVLLVKRAHTLKLQQQNRDLLTELAVFNERLDARQEKITGLEEERQGFILENRTLLSQNRGLEVGLEQAREQTVLLQKARAELTESFKAVSSDIYRSNNESFLKLAKSTLSHFHLQANGDLDQRKKAINDLVKPLHESLQKVDTHIRRLEQDRAGAYSSLLEQVKSMAEGQARLQGETANLVRALRTPAARGRWGEMQLRRVVEMAGMVERCDFNLQKTVDSGEGLLRPDMVVNLPNGKNIVVDAKASFQAYLEAQEAEDDNLRLDRLKAHARQIRTHLTQLGSKSYWQQFDQSPEFVVMFIPGENFFSAALMQDPELIEFGVSHRVIPATPTTLIALLRAVAYGWSQDQISEHAKQIGELGKTLFERLRILSGYFEDLRKNLDRSVQSYNKAAGSFEGRVLVTARKFQDIDPSLDSSIPELGKIDKTTRGMSNEDL